MTYRFILTGGGTAGHINPAITIADSLKKFYAAKGDTCEIIFTGRKEGLEGTLVPKAGYELRNISAKPFPMKPNKKLIDAFKAMAEGKKQCLAIIDEFKPDAVIGTGGYVCGPLFQAAKSRKIPVMIHEANAFPGRANRLYGRNAALVMTGFPNLEGDFKKAKKVVFTGNPIRSIMFGNNIEDARKNIGLGADEKMVFAMGGSLGAQTINNFIFDAAADPAFQNVKFVLGIGKQRAGGVDLSSIPANVTAYEYIDNPNDYLCGADVCITRAGAVTCAESAAIGSCSVFIPYPHAAHDHQTFNAKAFVDVDGGILVPDGEVSDKLKGELLKLLEDDDRRMKMRENAKKIAVNDCDERITNSIHEIVSK